MVQINLEVQWPQKRINILDVLKPTEEEIAKYYKNRNSEIDSNNDDSFSPDNKSPNKFTFKNETSRTNDNDYDNDREEMNNSFKRNQKPSECSAR